MKETPDKFPSLSVKIQSAEEETAEQAVESRATSRRYAVLVCHGMGQQVKFETLDSVARAVHSAAVDCGTADKAKKLDVSLHADEGEFIGRAELALKLPDGEKVDVHFYEAYWAPLTEGRVSLRETLTVFLGAGKRGLQFAYGDGVFDRWMFGRRREFEIPARRILQLGLGLWMLVLLTFSFAAASVAPLAELLEIVRGGGVSSRVAGFVAGAFSIGAVLALLGAACVLVAGVLGNGPDIEQPRSKVGGQLGEMAPSWARRNGVAAGVAILIAGSGVVAWLSGRYLYLRWLLPTTLDPWNYLWCFVAAAALFAFEAIVLFLVVRGFLVQFAGDVAAYVSAYRVSKFHEIRKEIQERGKRVARFIYSARTDDGKEFLYENVAIVGHSLGSVLAYDTLNDAINRDLHAGGWGDGIGVKAFDVTPRTQLLLTFGSPLDKTAFVFRTQKTETETDVREALAAAIQPMIADYANRPGRWINLWSGYDWISGPLGYYDEPGRQAADRVLNIEQRGSFLPWKAHTEYWDKPLLPGVLHAAITNICPRSITGRAQTGILGAFTGCVLQPPPKPPQGDIA